MLKRVLERVPLAFVVLCIISGILANELLRLDPILWIALSLGLLIATCISPLQKYGLLTVAGLLIALGGMNHSLSVPRSPRHLANLSFENRNSLQAVVEKSEKYREQGQRLTLKQVELKRNEWYPLRGRLLLNIEYSRQSYLCGDRIYFTAQLYKPSSRRNPGEFDYREYLRRHHIYALAYLEDEQNVEIIPAANFAIRRLANRVKYAVEELIERSMSGESRAILKALILGIRGEISADVEQTFIDSGVIHVLAVSGLHVGYVTLAFWVLFGFLRLPRKPKVILTILMLAFYALIVDLKPSVVRAVIMASLLLIGRTWEKQTQIYNTVAAAACIQLLIDPFQLFDLGFQLSFIAVLSIVYVYKRLTELLPPGFSPDEVSNRVLKRIYQLFLVSLAALLGTVPLTIFYFQRIPLISLIANLIAVPLVGLIGALGFAQVLTGMVWSGFAICYGEVEMLLIRGLQFILHQMASFPLAYLNVPQISPWLLVFLYLVLLGILNSDRRKVRFGTLVLILGLANFQVWRTVLLPPSWQLLFFDVGQGDAALVRFPSKRYMLIDCGARTFRRNYAQLVLGPYLRRQGIRRIDVLALSHPHNDHIGGAPYLLRHFRIGRIWEPGVVAHSKCYREIHHLADSLKIPVERLWAGDRLVIDRYSEGYVFHPSVRFARESAHSFNDHSNVIQLRFRKFRVLMTGDAERESEEYMLTWQARLASQVIKVPHHGSGTSSTEEFVRRVAPQIAVVSVGERNKFGHPSSGTLKRYIDIGSSIHRTDQQGACSLTITAKYMKIDNAD